MDTFDWLKDRSKRVAVVVDLSQIGELRGIKEVDGGLEIGALTTLTEVMHHAGIREKFGILSEAAGAGGVAADPEPGHARRQRVAGHALLVLPQRLDVLPGRRQHLLRRHADGDQPGARDSRGRPLRGGESVGHRAGADRAGRVDGVAARRRRRAGGAGGGVFRRAGARHHADDGAAAGRAADGDSDSVDVGGRAVLLREGARPAGVGLPAGERGLGDEGERRDDSGRCGWRSARWRRRRCG